MSSKHASALEALAALLLGATRELVRSIGIAFDSCVLYIQRRALHSSLRPRIRAMMAAASQHDSNHTGSETGLSRDDEMPAIVERYLDTHVPKDFSTVRYVHVQRDLLVCRPTPTRIINTMIIYTARGAWNNKCAFASSPTLMAPRLRPSPGAMQRERATCFPHWPRTFGVRLYGFSPTHCGVTAAMHWNKALAAACGASLVCSR